MFVFLISYIYIYMHKITIAQFSYIFYLDISDIKLRNNFWNKEINIGRILIQFARLILYLILTFSPSTFLFQGSRPPVHFLVVFFVSPVCNNSILNSHNFWWVSNIYFVGWWVCLVFSSDQTEILHLSPAANMPQTWLFFPCVQDFLCPQSCANQWWSFL